MDLEITMLLDEIDEQQYMAEMAVMDALMDAYMKEATMLEYCSEEVVQECFYQEGLMDDIKVGIKGVDGESVIKKILLFIPRLIASFCKWIAGFFKKDTSSSIVNAKKEYDSSTPEQKEAMTTACEIADKCVSENRQPTPQETQTLASKLEIIDDKTGKKVSFDTVMNDKDSRLVFGKSDGIHAEPVKDTSKQKDSDSNNETAADIGNAWAGIAREILTDMVQFGNTQKSRMKGKTFREYNNSTSMMYFTEINKALNHGKMYSGVDFELVKHNLEIYEQLVRKIEKAFKEYDSVKGKARINGDVNSYKKFEKTIMDIDKYNEANFKWGLTAQNPDGSLKPDAFNRSMTLIGIGHKYMRKSTEIPLGKIPAEYKDVLERIKKVYSACQELGDLISGSHEGRSGEYFDSIDEKSDNAYITYRDNMASINKDPANSMYHVYKNDYEKNEAVVMSRTLRRVSNVLQVILNDTRSVARTLNNIDGNYTYFIGAMKRMKHVQITKGTTMSQKLDRAEKLNPGVKKILSDTLLL